MIMDDEWMMCEALQRIITAHCPDFEVKDISYNGLDGLKLMETNRYDVILTDIRMPKMDGLEFLRKIRERNNQIPVVIITGHNEFEYTRKAIRLGATDYILKPLDKGEIKEVLNQLAELIRKDSGREAANDWDRINGGVKLIASMTEYMQEHYRDEKLSIAYFSEKMDFNPSYLSRLFKMEIGKGFVHYLTDIRIEHAKRLLASSELQIWEIGERVGYLDKNHFGKVFKKEVGVPPGEYREKLNLS